MSQPLLAKFHKQNNPDNISVWLYLPASVQKFFNRMKRHVNTVRRGSKLDI